MSIIGYLHIPQMKQQQQQQQQHEKSKVSQNLLARIVDLKWACLELNSGTFCKGINSDKNITGSACH